MVRRLACLLVIVCALGSVTRATAQDTVANLTLGGSAASTWGDGKTSVIQLSGPVSIELDQTHVSADGAVVWLNSTVGTEQPQVAEIALIGHASVKQTDSERTGSQMFVTARVRGAIRIVAAERNALDESNTPLYKSAVVVRQGNQSVVNPPPAPAAGASVQQALPVGFSAPPPVVPPPTQLVRFQADEVQFTYAADHTVAITLGGHVLLMVDRPKHELIEMRGDHIVVFTRFKSAAEARGAGGSMRDKVSAVYLEGDVRLEYTPPDGAKNGEQRMTANRCYYELATDRAVLTKAVFRTIDPKSNTPIIMRADVLRQLAKDQYSVQNVRMTTSTFANPSFAVAASSAYVERVEAPNPDEDDRFNFYAKSIEPEFFGIPVLYLPIAGGSIDEKEFPLRNIQIVNSSRFGTGLETDWGLLETLGYPSPKDLDLSFRADYFSDRGPAGGIDAKYSGGFVTDTTKQPWNFEGNFKSYFVQDHGVDDLGADRLNVDPSETLRGRILWEHQQFLPEDWQVQLRAGYVSDATFLEEWFPREWEDGEPEDMQAYFKRQRDTEALTFLVNYQPNHIVTDAEYVQEQFETAHLPEVGYRRIGDSFADDNLTFFSDNTAGGYRAIRSGASLLDQGYGPNLSPGLPSVGQTGVTGETVYRSNFREEVDYPINAGHFKFVPYVMTELTDYSDSPNAGQTNRLYVAAGTKLTTAFWQTDDSIESDLFDIHRVRHVIEPELNLYTSTETTDRNSVYIYDEDVDDIYDVSAASLAIRQRWQTKRGGPGRWRSVDFFTLDVEANGFLNKPKDSELPPSDFRGLFFPSMPEASVPRDSVNIDTSWRISDDTILLGDEQYNADENKIATAAVGLAVRRSDRVTYTLGNSFINELKSNITSVGVDYTISKKYSISYNQSFDFGHGDNLTYNAQITRHFDTFALLFRVDYDELSGESSVGINIAPNGARSAVGTDAASAFNDNKR